MTYGIRLPDGSTVGFTDDVPMEQAQLLVRKNFPEAFQKKSGVGAEFKEGLASLISRYQTIKVYAPRQDGLHSSFQGPSISNAEERL